MHYGVPSNMAQIWNVYSLNMILHQELRVEEWHYIAS
jgi:hypothetical protein